MEELETIHNRRIGKAAGLQQSALFEQYTNMLCTLSQKKSLVLFIDDLHWADAGSTSLLFHLGTRLRDAYCRILILTAYRPDEAAITGSNGDHPLRKLLVEFKRRFGDVWIDLARADERSGQAFVEEFLATEPNRLKKDFHTILFSLTGGHPLFTIEMLRAMQARGDVVRDASGSWVETEMLSWNRIPARVEAVIGERMDRLDPRERQMLAAASVEGEQFTAQVLAQVEGLEEREVLSTLSQNLETNHRLVQSQTLTCVGEQNIAQYRFSHALHQVFVYNALSAGERQLLHGDVALALEELYAGETEQISVSLAHHYLEGGWAEKGLVNLLRAGEQARLAYASTEAIAHYQRALALLDEDPADPTWVKYRLEAQLGLGQTLFGIGKNAEAETQFKEAIAAGKEIGLPPEALVRLYYWLGEALFWLSRWEDYLQIATEALELLEPGSETVEMALVNHMLSMGYLWARGDRGKDTALRQRNTKFIQNLPYEEILAPAYLMICEYFLYFDVSIRSAREWLQILEDKARTHGDTRTLGQVQHRLAMTAQYTGDLQLALDHTDKGIEIFKQIGDLKHLCWCQHTRADCWTQLGDFRQAEEILIEGLASARIVESKRDIANINVDLGLIKLCRGEHEKAVKLFQDAIRLNKQSGLLLVEIGSRRHLGRTFMTMGDHLAAFEQFQACLEMRGNLFFTESNLLKGDLLILSSLEATAADLTRFRNNWTQSLKDTFKTTETPKI